MTPSLAEAVELARECSHSRQRYTIAHVFAPNRYGQELVCAEYRCDGCYQLVPQGKSNDEGVAVAIEIEAATFVSESLRTNPMHEAPTHGCFACGWEQRETPEGRRYDAGYLARCIWEHES